MIILKNKILQRIAAYKDINNKENIDISQKISQEHFMDFYKANAFLLDLIDNINIKDFLSKFVKTLQYAIYGNIGIFGFDYKKNNKKVTIEFQLGILTANSIVQSTNFLTQKLNESNLPIDKQKQIIDKFEKIIDNNYYFLAILPFVNSDYITHKAITKEFPRKYTIPQIKNWCIQNTNQYLI